MKPEQKLATLLFSSNGGTPAVLSDTPLYIFSIAAFGSSIVNNYMVFGDVSACRQDTSAELFLNASYPASSNFV